MRNDELNWQKILEIGASSLGSSIGTAIINEMFSTTSDGAREAVQQALEEVCDRIKKIIDEAFLNQYIASCGTVAYLLKAYADSCEVKCTEGLLIDLFTKASDLVNQLKRFDTFESLTALLYICTLHLTAIKALSDINSGYKITLSDTGHDYASLCEPIGDRLVEFTEASVGEAMFDISSSYLIFTDPTPSNPYLTLKFRFYFVDEWDENPDTRVHMYDSDPPISLTESLWYKKEGTQYELTELGKNAPPIQSAYLVARNDIQTARDNFLNDRLEVSKKMRENILSACAEWGKL